MPKLLLHWCEALQSSYEEIEHLVQSMSHKGVIVNADNGVTQ